MSRGAFYESARFCASDETAWLLWDAGFRIRRTAQALFGLPSEVSEVESPRSGVGEGGHRGRGDPSP